MCRLREYKTLIVRSLGFAGVIIHAVHQCGPESKATHLTDQSLKNRQAMDTVSVDLVYRPLRICWAIAPGDIDAFRKVMRLNFTFWGGRFNPIVTGDGTERPDELVEAFRPDFIMGMGTDPSIEAFTNKYPYLGKPFFHDGLFIRDPGTDAKAQLLDIHNAIVAGRSQ